MVSKRLLMACSIAGWLAFAILLLYNYLTSTSINARWHTQADDKPKIGFTPAAFLDEISNPGIHVTSHGWKLIARRGDVVDWGWKVEVNMNKVPMEQIPEKHRIEKKIGERFTMLPLEKVPFNAKILYRLEDEDGFPVAEDTLDVTVLAGEASTFQKESTLPLSKAVRAARGKVEILFTGNKR